MAGLVKQTPGSFGYVELIYALQNKMPYGTIKNKKGKFVKPSIASTSLAANTALPDDMKVDLTDTDAADGYPISGFTWILVYKEQNYAAIGGKSQGPRQSSLVDDPRGAEIRRALALCPALQGGSGESRKTDQVDHV